MQLAISKIIKELRLKHNLRQVDMAVILGISRVTYNKKERGIKDFTIKELIIIKNYFNLESVGSIFLCLEVINT